VVRTLGTIAALILLFAGSASAAAPAGGAARHGYALLFALLAQEKDVAQLLIIKDEKSELGALIEEIAHVTGEAHEELERLAEAPPPPATAARTKILLAAKGKELELQLLLAQTEALGYLSNLTQVLSRGESDPERLTFLRALWKDLARVHGDAVGMLRRHYR
jgi:hypothetical protein